MVEKLVISTEKKVKYFNTSTTAFSEIYKRLSGKLLTTLEIAFYYDNEQLHALKRRFSDIQAETWNEMRRVDYQLFIEFFEFSDEKRITSSIPAEEEYNSVVEKFRTQLDHKITLYFARFHKRIWSLVSLMSNSVKSDLLNIEFSYLINKTSTDLRIWLGLGIDEIFLDKVSVVTSHSTIQKEPDEKSEKKFNDQGYKDPHRYSCIYSEEQVVKI